MAEVASPIECVWATGIACLITTVGVVRITISCLPVIILEPEPKMAPSMAAISLSVVGEAVGLPQVPPPWGVHYFASAIFFNLGFSESLVVVSK